MPDSADHAHTPAATQRPSGHETNGARRAGSPRTICPYCGTLAPPGGPCPSCQGRFDPLSRQASQNAMGPWFVRDQATPHGPGASFETIARLVRRGRIGQDTVVRGPTTHQFWTLAKWAPGVAELLGQCHCCGAEATPDTYICSTCGTPLAIDRDRQHLGLQPVRPLTPEQARAHDREPSAPSQTSHRPAHPPADPPPQAGRPTPPPAPLLTPPSPPSAATEAEPKHDAEPATPTRRTPSATRSSPALAVALAIALLAAVAGWGLAAWQLVEHRQDRTVPASPQRAAPAQDATDATDADEHEPAPASNGPDLGQPEATRPSPAGDDPPAAPANQNSGGTPTEAPEPTLEDRVMALLADGTLESAEKARATLEAIEADQGLDAEGRELLEFVRTRIERLRLRDVP